MSEIKFGTDGWRAIIDKDFTPENISKVIQAFCDVYSETKNRLVFVGYDRRNKSRESAYIVANILAANNFKVSLAQDFCPTPCVSWNVKNQKAFAGVMITASHNPAEWNGIKFKESYGGAASPEYTAKIECQILVNETEKRLACLGNFEAQIQSGQISFFDPYELYIKGMQSFFDMHAIQAAVPKIVVDPLYGAGTNYFKRALNFDLIQIHDAADTSFGGLNPEPIEKNLKLLCETVLKNQADIGLATDGDADRIGAVDADGKFINSHQIFALLLLHNLRHRKLKGAIVKSVSTTELISKICKKYDFELIETPIGFKHICQELVKHDALMGGEESGGISLREHVHERDGVFNGLMLLEMMALNKKSLAALIADMDAEFGKFYFARNDYHLNASKITEIKNLCAKQEIHNVGKSQVTRYNTLDGTKIHFDDDSWLLIRASGTEPLLRVYAEAKSQARVEELLGFAKNYLEL